MKNLIIAFSERYEGLGVFADRDYTEGEVVNTYDIANRIDEDMYSILPISEKWQYYYDIKNRTVYRLDEVTVRINHSCSPNITSDKNGSDFAIKPIKKGEEITAWYMVYNLNGLTCLCGESNCLGKVSL